MTQQPTLPFKNKTTYQATNGKFIGSDEDPICTCQSMSFERRIVGPHLGRFCIECGKWHSWVVHEVIYDPNFVLTFGIHKGMKISKLPTEYLEYGVKNFNGAQKKRFQMALEERIQGFGRCLYKAYKLTFIGDNSWPLVPLKNVLENFCSIHNIGVGRFHRYLGLYAQLGDKARYRVDVDPNAGDICVRPKD